MNTEQAQAFQNDGRPDIAVRARAVLRDDPGPGAALLRLAAGSPGIGDRVDNGDGTIDQAKVTDADLLAITQARFPDRRRPVLPNRKRGNMTEDPGPTNAEAEDPGPTNAPNTDDPGPTNEADPATDRVQHEEPAADADPAPGEEAAAESEGGEL